MDNKINTTIFQLIKWGSYTSIISIVIMSIYFTLAIKIPEQYEIVIGILGIFIFFIPIISFVFITYMVILKIINKFNLATSYGLKNILFLFLMNILFLMGYLYLGLSLEGKI
ncbi:hypothetical protein J2Y60_000491 [Arcicella sp. BE140]|nr:hypothetical protein [Arcicella sp. BE51]MDR6810310.1 hypothetical protein [Arcicella sp. BE140]MDR6821660.1 hypothetical protein [Arcicella sp. BE139]